MNTYRTYSTAIKIYYSLGLQNQFVSKEIRSGIPNSTTDSWKKTKFDHLIGNDLEKNIQQNLSEIQLLYHSKAAFPRKLATAQIRFILLLTSMFEKRLFQKALRKNKTALINFLDRFEEQISYERLSRILNVSSKTLYHWRTQVKYTCESSALLLCAKRHPNQATIQEAQSIKEWLSKKEYAHWGIHSIWAKAFKEGFTNLSKQAWYHYNKLLKIRVHPSKGNKKKHHPLRAERINQIWHADITVFKTLDGIKYYIYTVMDNYSRFIHSWRIETVVSAKIRLETIQDALANAFQRKDFESLQLVTDGGSENDNLILKAFMLQNQTSIYHNIALRDIVQSNSMMEAFYRTTKYQWLYLKQIHNGLQLNTGFENWINQYHYEKPHYALGIYTPFEILSGSDKNESFNVRMKLAAQCRNAFAEALNLRVTALVEQSQRRRIREINRKSSCKVKCTV